MTSLISQIRQSKRIVIVSHVHPDGDAVGSTLGLTLSLTQLGFQAEAYLRDGVATVFQFLDGWKTINTSVLPSDADLCIILDAPDAARTGYGDLIRAYAKRGALAYVDHHPDGDLSRLATSSLSKRDVSSTAELVVELIRELGTRITNDIATALLTGMYTDTGGFQYSNTREATMQMSADLMRRGARLNKIVQHISHQKSVAHLKLVGMALERLEVSWGGRCAVSALTHADMLAVNAKDEDLIGVVNELNTLSGVKFTLLLTELIPGDIRGSFRTADGSMFNVAALARVMGGGGHPRAAGFTVPGRISKGESGWRVEPFLVS